MKIIGSHKANIVFIFVAAYIVFINFYSTMTVLPQYILQLGGTEFHAGLQSTLFFVAAIILRLYFGPLADSRGRKPPLLIGSFVFATSSLFFYLSDSVLTVTLARLYQAVGMATFLSSSSSFVADIAPPERMGTYVGAYRLFISLSLLTGPFASQYIIDLKGFATWFVTSFIIGGISFVLITMIKAPVFSSSESTSSLERLLKVAKKIELRPIFFGIFLVSICYGTLLTFASLYISRNSGISNPGLYFTYFGVISIAANVLAGYLSDCWGRQLIVWPSVMFSGIGLASLYFLKMNESILLVSSIMSGIGFAGGISVLVAWLVDVAGKEIRATVLAFQESTIDLSIAIGSLFIGFTAQYLGLGFSFAILGVAICFAGIYFFIKHLYN